jgi:hypothetical protein
MRLAPLPILAALLTAGAAQAQDRPPPMPTRDVQVTYESEDRANAGRVSWLTSEGRLRIESEAQRGVILVDTRGGGVMVVLEREREFHDMGKIAAVTTSTYHVIGPRNRLRREGEERIAGQACTVWRILPPVQDGDDAVEPRRACITADGVPLRLVEGEGEDAVTHYTAKQVSYGQQDPARFRVPEGYKPMEFGGSAPRRR